MRIFAITLALALGLAPGARAEDAKVMDFLQAFAAPLPAEIKRLDYHDLNDDGVPEALVILGGDFCGARYCDGLVLELSGSEARPLGHWMVATMRVARSKLNGWQDIEVNDARLRYDGTRYE